MDGKVNRIVFFNAKQKKVFERLVTLIKEAYKERLVSLAVYGSYAGRRARLNSDLDIFIILNERDSLHKEFDLFYEKVESALEEELMELYDKFGIDMEISPFIVDAKEAEYFNPLYLDMLEETIILYDKDDYLKGILQRVKDMKEKYNFRKEYIANRHIWDMSRKNMIGEKV